MAVRNCMLLLLVACVSVSLHGASAVPSISVLERPDLTKFEKPWSVLMGVLCCGALDMSIAHAPMFA